MAADRYLKKQGLSLTGTILEARVYYLPFYRFRGVSLNFTNRKALVSTIKYQELAEATAVDKKPKLKAKDFDVTIPAFDSGVFGLSSLGIRPKAVPLYCFRREEIPEGTVLVNSEITPTQAEDKALKMRDSNMLLYDKQEADISAMIGERVSAIYFPIWALTYDTDGQRKTVFVDALAKRGYNQIEGDFEYDQNEALDGNSHFVMPTRHQCPNCGADLKDDSFSLFYPCYNCDRSYMLGPSGDYMQVKVKCADSNLVAPFWRFSLDIKADIPLKTVADFSRILTAEIALLRKEKRENQFYLYSPAFKSRDAKSWFKNAYSMLVTQPHDELSEKLPRSYLPFTIDEGEAREMAIFLWKRLAMKYAWQGQYPGELTESMLPGGEIIWLPAQNYALIDKAVSYKEVDVAK